MSRQEIVGSSNLVLDREVSNCGVSQTCTNCDENIRQRFCFRDDRFNPMQCQDGFLRRNPDNRFKEVSFQATVATSMARADFPTPPMPSMPIIKVLLLGCKD